MTRLKDNRICLIVYQEPISKGKGILDFKEAKLNFRSAIKKQLDDFEIKPFNNGEKLAVKISFYTNNKNKFLLHNLVKNYLDLLHKPLYSRKNKRYLDHYDGLLFTDDSQIKILAAEKIKSEESEIIIQIYLLTEFYQKLDNIVRIPDVNQQTNEEDYFGNLESYNELKQIGKGEKTLKRFQLLTRAQKEYLFKSQFNIVDFKYFFLHEIPSFNTFNEKYQGDNELLKSLFNGNNTCFTAYNKLKDFVNFSIGFEGFDFKRTNNILKIELRNKLREFKNRNLFLFPFVYPISLTVIVMQSKNQVVKDIDNLVKEFFVKLINSTFKAPEKPIVPYFELNGTNFDKQKMKRGIINKYQVIEIEYDEFNSKQNNGWVGFCLGDIYTYKDVFSLIEQ